MLTEDAPKMIVRRVEDGDGIRAWGLLHARYSRNTMTRLMRLMHECMYPKAAKVCELQSSIMAWEERRKRMIREQPEGTRIPDIWKMAAMLRICPKEIVDMVELRWDEIGERFEVLRERVIGWATTKTEKMGGAVPMEVDEVKEEYDEYNYEYYDGGEADQVAAVYANTRCYYCQGYGHMARECPMKGKGKGGKPTSKGKGKGTDSKGGGKAMAGKGWGKAGENKGGYKGKAEFSKGGQVGGKGFGYQGQCWTCGQVGHKSAECKWNNVNEVEGDEGEQQEEECGVIWTVGNVEVVPEVPKLMQGGGSHRAREGDWRKTRCMQRECCGGECGAPRRRTLDDFMPKRVEVHNMFADLAVNGIDEEDDDEGETINEVHEAEKDKVINEVVEITIDSGAARSVWPVKKKGVKRTKIDGRAPKLAAANGTPIRVEGNAMLEFISEGQDCGMHFLDTEVRKPLAAVSAMEDAGNTVVFSRGGSYVQNDLTGKRIPLERRGGTYVMKLEMKDGKKRGMSKKETTDMEIEGIEDEEMNGNKKEVFRRQT